MVEASYVLVPVCGVVCVCVCVCLCRLTRAAGGGGVVVDEGRIGNLNVIVGCS